MLDARTPAGVIGPQSPVEAVVDMVEKGDAVRAGAPGATLRALPIVTDLGRSARWPPSGTKFNVVRVAAHNLDEPHPKVVAASCAL
jgi:hypothetical protein